MNTNTRVFSSLVAAVTTLIVSPAQAIDITRASVTSAGVQGNDASLKPSVSSSGDLVAFSSVATNLVSGDTNGKSDIFIRTRSTRTTSRVSQSSGGVEANGASTAPTIASGGQHVVYLSDATNLVGFDTNNTAGDGKNDVFVTNLVSGATTRANLTTGGTEANDGASSPSISSDGRFVVFASKASNLTPSDTNGLTDIFLRDTTLNTTTLVSSAIGGLASNNDSASPVISADGNFVVFVSKATNLVTSDLNAKDDIFVYNVATPGLERVSVSSAGTEANDDSLNPSISSTGRYIAFESKATNLFTPDTNTLRDVFLRDRDLALTTRISSAFTGAATNGDSVTPAISLDGSTVAFLSDGTNLVTSDSNNTAGDGQFDVFSFDITGAANTRKNLNAASSQITGTNSGVAINSTGTVIAFGSLASGLVSGDTNGKLDVFVNDLTCSSDSDGDTVVDCSDACPLSSDKTTPGICGCNLAETDTDTDGTPDCTDACPADSAKSAVGACGCGRVDSDGNGNGVADCSDPRSTTRPQTPSVQVVKKDIKVSAPAHFVNVTYVFTLSKDGRRKASITSTKRTARFTNVKNGTYTVTYVVKVGNITSRSSSGKSAKVK